MKNLANIFSKKVYPRAVYDKWSKSWEDDSFFIDYDLKDIQTSEGEKRYVALNYGTGMGIMRNFYLYIFKKVIR